MYERRRVVPRVLRRGATVLMAPVLLLSVAAIVTGVPAAEAEPIIVPPGFVDETAFGGFTQPTGAAFAPDGRAFVIEKSGIVKVFDSLTDTTATVFADLRDQVHDFWDRGMTGVVVDPAFPERPYVYVAFAYDAPPGQTAPYWGDQCPTPPGATADGCVAQGRISRLTMGPAGTATTETPLVTDWCAQFPSHSIDALQFGPDGALYASAGDGASFTFADYGQNHNMCGDPPSPAGTSLTAPTARGGALRTQSLRRPAGEPVSLDGTIIRIDPDTGDGMPGNPFAASTDANAKRIIAYGMRNPFRFTFRPGFGDELWVGDVGWTTWEELNRIPHATDGVAENFGWPCYEGDARQPSYDGLDLTMCESLYQSGGHSGPYYRYSQQGNVTTEDCEIRGSSVTGVAFEDGTSNYPAAYRGALFFADSSRGCIWAMQLGSNGQPDPTRIVPFAHSLQIPVQLLTGPGGDLFYVALEAGSVHRIKYPGGTNRAPVARFTATPPSGPAPLTVQFDATSSFDPDGDPVTYAWDLDADGAYDDSTVIRPTFTYADAEFVDVRLKVTDNQSAAGTTTVQITVGNPVRPEPVPAIDTPDAALRWSVGQTVQFSGHATDAKDGPLPASALSWRLTLQHCQSTGCHAHVIQNFDGVSGGSFVGPDHEYPSHLELTLTANDSDGNTSSQTARLDPKTIFVTYTTKPTGLQLIIGTGQYVLTPYTQTVIVGSTNTVTAVSPQTRPADHLKYMFVKWSDGYPKTRTFVAPPYSITLEAQYRPCILTCK